MTKKAPEQSSFAYQWRLLNPAVRGYLLGWGVALGILLLSNFQRGGPAALVFPLIVAIMGMLVNSKLMPLGFLVMQLYLQAFPFVLPTGSEFAVPLEESYFQVHDLIFAVCLLIYLHCQFHIYSLADRAVPDEEKTSGNVDPKDGERRPFSTVTESELPRLIMLIALVVLAGQIGWLLISLFQIQTDSWFPLRIREFSRSTLQSSTTVISLGWSRLILLSVTLAFLVIACRIAFGIWAWHRLNLEEARMVLIDGNWGEQRRDLARLETWRAWPRMRHVKPIPISPPTEVEKKENAQFTWGSAVRVFVIILGLVIVYLVLLAILSNWP